MKKGKKVAKKVLSSKNPMEVVCILDKSGSMQPLANDTIGGFNTYIESLQDIKKKINVSLITFDTNYNILYSGVDKKKVEKLTDKEYRADGMTALLDAVGKAISEMDKRIDGMAKKDKPSSVIFFITTDGQENSSREYKIEQIKEKIKNHTEKDKWSFIFSGANIDAFGAGMSMGISKGLTNNYIPSAVGTKALYSTRTLWTKLASSNVSMNGMDFNDMYNKELDKIEKKDKKEKKDAV